MWSAGLLLLRTCVVLLCLAVVPREPAKVHAAGVDGGNGLLGIPTKASLVHCPPRCGNVDIPYPFGIGQGCFRRGFELTCDSTTHPPRLFFANSSTQITSIYSGYTVAWTPAVGYNVTMTAGAGTSITKSWKAPIEGAVTRDNALSVVGCGVEAYMFGDNTTDLIGSCISVCADNREIMESGYDTCGRFGCCAIWTGGGRRDLPSFFFKLVRRNSTIAQFDEVLSNVKVILSQQYRFVIDDLYASWVNTSNVDDIQLDIPITGQPSCASAQAQENKHTYACNDESICYDRPRGGYNCYCPGHRDGNPYVVDGCIKDYNPRAPIHNNSVPFWD